PREGHHQRHVADGPRDDQPRGRRRGQGQGAGWRPHLRGRRGPLERRRMSQARATFTESFAVSPEALFEVMSDHEGMSEWIGARVSVVRGPADGGVGTVRRVHAPGFSIDEEVTYADPPRRMVYRIVRGAP